MSEEKLPTPVETKTEASSFKLSTGAENGHVLTSDATGVGTWQAPSGGGGSATTVLNPSSPYTVVVDSQSLIVYTGSSTLIVNLPTNPSIGDYFKFISTSTSSRIDVGSSTHDINRYGYQTASAGVHRVSNFDGMSASVPGVYHIVYDGTQWHGLFPSRVTI